MTQPRELRPLAIALAALIIFSTQSRFAVAAETIQSFQLRGAHRVTMKTRPWKKQGHKLHYCGSVGAKYVCRVDDRPFFGTDGELPRREIVSMLFTIDGLAIELDTSSMFDPEEPTFRVRKDGRGVALVGCFGIGAGSYHVTWHIEDGRAERTRLVQASP